MIIVFDVETTGLQFKIDTVTHLSIMFVTPEKKIIGDNVQGDKIRYFGEIIAKYPDATYIGHNIKFDLRMLEVSPDIVDSLHIIDTTILYHFLYPRESNKLGDIEYALFQTQIKNTYLERYGKDFNLWPEEELRDYNVSDVRLTYSVYNLLNNKVDKKFLQFQEKYLKTLYRMEYNGFAFDEKEADKNYKALMLLEDAFELELRDYIYTNYGYEKSNTINFNSSKQLSTLLYVDLDIPKPDRNMFPSGKAYDKLFTSTLTNADLLKTISDPFVKMFLEWKEIGSLAKGIKSYSDLAVDGRLYPSFNITGTVTGRLSCSKPNLQNIAKKKKGKNLPDVRSLFRPNDREQLISIDYQQQEIRMLAVLSQDKNLLELVNQGTDMHTVVGKKMFRKEELTKEERGIIKNIHFG